MSEAAHIPRFQVTGGCCGHKAIPTGNRSQLSDQCGTIPIWASSFDRKIRLIDLRDGGEFSPSVDVTNHASLTVDVVTELLDQIP